MKRTALAIALALSVAALLSAQASNADCRPGSIPHPLAPANYCMPVGAEACNAQGNYCNPGWHCCRDEDSCLRIPHHSLDGCYPGPEELAKINATEQKTQRDARRAAEQQMPPPSATAAHCEQLLVPGAWAFETKCVQGSGGDASSRPNIASPGPNRDARDAWIRQSIGELARDLANAAPTDQMPPEGDTVVWPAVQAASPAGPRDQRAALPPDQPNATLSDDQCPPAIPAKYWGDADYCAKASASCVDRGSALYGYLCFVPNKPDATADSQDPGTAEMDKRLRSIMSKVRPRVYKPAMSPQALRALAYNSSICKKKPLADKPRCFEDAEVKLLLESDDEARADCASIADSIARWNQAVDASPGSDALKDSLRWVCAPDPDVRATCGSITDRKVQLECVDAVYAGGPRAWSALRSTLDKLLGGNSIQK